MITRPPIASYFDASHVEHEWRESLALGVRYVGHQLMVPDVNDYIVPTTHDERYVMFHRGAGYDIVSNVCLHRQARLLTGSGNSRVMTCKLHSWAYGMDGKLRSTPRFTGDPPGDLARRNLTEWNGLLFDGRPPDFDLHAEGLDEFLSFDGYFYAGTQSTSYDYNWKTFSEIYLDNYHVPAVHRGLNKYINIDDVSWGVGDDYSVQWVGLTRDITKAGSPAFADWQKAISRQHGGNLPKYGALWIYIYPNIMIEWYPHVKLISTVYPVGPEHCVNHVEYFYPRAMHDVDPDYFAVAERWQAELAEEDADACRLQSHGRRALFANGENENGPTDPLLEHGVEEFYRFLSPIYQNKGLL